jgi:hypothetical protein
LALNCCVGAPDLLPARQRLAQRGGLSVARAAASVPGAQRLQRWSSASSCWSIADNQRLLTARRQPAIDHPARATRLFVILRHAPPSHSLTLPW